MRTAIGSGGRGFTLIEVLIALAIMAVGTTAAIGLFTAATAMQKRALDQTTAALLADMALADARGAVSLTFDAKALEAARPATSKDPPVLFFRRNATHSDYPGYVYDLLLTPIDAVTPEEADAFHAEVRVRWKMTNRVRVSDFRTVILRRISVRDLR